jgi:hypothetical protein
MTMCRHAFTIVDGFPFDGYSGSTQVERLAFARLLFFFESVDALYVTPLRAISIDSITIFSRTNKVITLTGVPEYVKFGPCHRSRPEGWKTPDPDQSSIGTV